MTQQSFSGNDQPFSYEQSTQPDSIHAPLERSEKFALGAVAGAVVAAVISQYLESRKQSTPVEQAQSRLARLRSTAKIRGAAKASSKQQSLGLKGALGAALGGAAVSGTTDKAKKRAAIALLKRSGEDPYAVSGSVRETLKEKLDEWRGGAATQQRRRGASLRDAVSLQAASAAIERTIGDPYAVSGSVRETLKEQLDQAGSSARVLGSSLKELAESAGDTTRSYTKEVQEYLKDAHLGEKAKEYSSVAADKAKQYGSVATAATMVAGAVAAEKTKDLVTAAQESLKEAHLDERLKDVGSALSEYGSEAAIVTSKAAKQSAVKLSSGASHLAEATSESAADLRKGVRKSVKRTRRRTRWGIRSFIIGLAIGLLTAPRSGDATREQVTSFVEDLLDVFISGNERSPIGR